MSVEETYGDSKLKETSEREALMAGIVKDFRMKRKVDSDGERHEQGAYCSNIKNHEREDEGEQILEQKDRLL